ncbi:Rft protein-domain-containing protein [Radiomyces spectabilis]|uniref:Rft protein-domain-containing protein n=1 Tax=Radiomyces spectabilis TaxID=64574 RepID=UPI00221ED489|nr:Rft protein-domain-containing protein [Radiomyces spectabilis]KAI8381124.1 Rft protein-domain-containing protein [Radiomyces spectabilis]
MPPKHPTPHADQAPTDEKDSLLFSSAKGAYYLVLLQLASRMLTFTLHQVVLRYTTAETLGIASVKLELLLSTILFISREGFRCALLRGDNEDSTLEKEKYEKHASSGEQKITNLAYIPTAIGLVTTFVACTYYLNQIDDVTAAKYPYYRTSVVLFGIAAFAELLVEPLFVLALNRLYFRLRVSVEGVAVLLRCFITFGLTLLGVQNQSSQANAYGVLAFAVAQLAFGLTMAIGYVGFFFVQVKQQRIDKHILFPRKLVAADKTYWFDAKLLSLAMTLTKQSLLKHVLTEGDKMLISVLSSDEDQGIYAFVVNYGSLIVRILFQPLEETGRTFFSKLLGEKTKQNEADVATAADVLLVTLKFHVMLGLLFTCFATNYTATLIDLLVGKAWSVDRNAPAVLATYCMYVPVMGVNGITEAFVQAVASRQDLTRLSYYMIGFSACFMVSGIVFMHVLQLGAIGLVFANMVNLGVRIAYSWHYIVTYFYQNGIRLHLRQWLPSRTTVLGFIISWAVTRWSESNIGWYTLHQKILHIGVGALCFGLTALLR